MLREPFSTDMILDQLQKLLDRVPAGAVLRVSSKGSSFYAARDDLKVTYSLDGSVCLIAGKLGESPDSLQQSSAVVRPERVDFVQVLPG